MLYRCSGRGEEAFLFYIRWHGDTYRGDAFQLVEEKEIKLIRVLLCRLLSESGFL